MFDLKNAIIRINGLLYVADYNDTNFEKGNMVIDKKDGAYGVIDMIMPNDHFAVRDNTVVEIGISKDRLIKLKILLSNN